MVYFSFVCSVLMKRSPSSSSPQEGIHDSPTKRLRSSDVPPIVAPIQDLTEGARCHRVVLETHPITKTELVAHLDKLWFSCGAEYQFLHSTSDPFEMPLLRFPPRDRPDGVFHPLLHESILRDATASSLYPQISQSVISSSSSFSPTAVTSGHMGFLAGMDLPGYGALPGSVQDLQSSSLDPPSIPQTSPPDGSCLSDS